MSVKVKRERADQRRHHRVTAPLYVTYEDTRLRASDWSLGGLKVVDIPGVLPHVGKELSLALSLPFQGFDVNFDVKVEVVRVEPENRGFAVKFTEIGDRESALMQHFIEELVRGSMTDVEDTIQRIDVPVTPASLKPDSSPGVKEVTKRRRLPGKVVAMSALYLVVGFMVLSYAAFLIYSNFFRLEVQTAVISAPLEVVTSQAEGHVRWKSVRPGDRVLAGQDVLTVVDNKLERDIHLTALEIKEQEVELAFLMRRQIDEVEKVQGFATISDKDRKQVELDVKSLEAQVHAAQLTHARLSHLHGNGHASSSRLEEAEKVLVDLEKRLEARKIELKARISLIERNIGKRFYNGEILVGDLPKIEAEVKRTEGRIEVARQKLEAFVRHRKRLEVRAPFDGILLELPRVDNSSIVKGNVIAVFEKENERVVLAFVTQNEALRIGIGDEVPVYIPALDETLTAHVVDVDRTRGFIKEHNRQTVPGHQWRGPIDRSAKVTLEFEEAERVNADASYKPGLPVIAIFPSRTTNSLMAGVARGVRDIWKGAERDVKKVLKDAKDGANHLLERIEDKARDSWIDVKFMPRTLEDWDPVNPIERFEEMLDQRFKGFLAKDSWSEGVAWSPLNPIDDIGRLVSGSTVVSPGRIQPPKTSGGDGLRVSWAPLNPIDDISGLIDRVFVLPEPVDLRVNKNSTDQVLAAWSPLNPIDDIGRLLSGWLADVQPDPFQRLQTKKPEILVDWSPLNPIADLARFIDRERILPRVEDRVSTLVDWVVLSEAYINDRLSSERAPSVMSDEGVVSFWLDVRGTLPSWPEFNVVRDLRVLWDRHVPERNAEDGFGAELHSWLVWARSSVAGVFLIKPAPATKEQRDARVVIQPVKYARSRVLH